MKLNARRISTELLEHDRITADVATLLETLPLARGREVLQGLIEASVSAGHDKNTLSWLRVRKMLGEEDFVSYLVALYRCLPTEQTAPYLGHDEPAFVQTRVWIYEYLLGDWACDIGNLSSLWRFRQLVALWPEEQWPSGQGKVQPQERKALAAKVREHLAYGFIAPGSQDDGADALFGPWMRQPGVPDDVLMLMAMARTKRGGVKLAKRDLRYGTMLDGLPESGLEAIAAIATHLRGTAREADAVLDDIVARNAIRYPRYNPTPHRGAYVFVEPDSIQFQVHSGLDVIDDTLVDAATAVEAARHKGQLMCYVGLTVTAEDWRRNYEKVTRSQMWGKNA